MTQPITLPCSDTQQLKLPTQSGQLAGSKQEVYNHDANDGSVQLEEVVYHQIPDGSVQLEMVRYFYDQE